MNIVKRQIVLNDQKLVYHQLGQGASLLFLHGGRVRALTFRKFLRLLAEHYTVIAPDIPGYGESSTPTGTWSFTEYGSFFEDFLKALTIKHISVIGYSMGGGIALNLAAQSSRVSKLVLVDASGLSHHRRSRLYLDMQRFFFYSTHPFYLAACFTLLQSYLSYIWKHKRDYQQMRKIRQKCIEQVSDEVFGRVSAPTLLVWGKNDWIYPVSMAYGFQSRLPKAEVGIVDGNHDWLVYNPLAGFSRIHQYLQVSSADSSV